MQLLSAEAILLDVVPLHENDAIVAFLTAERGKKRGVARGARRKFSRFAGQLQPLAKARVDWRERETSDLVRLSSVELLRPADPLQRDLEGILLSGYLADHVLEFASENEADPRMYRLLDSSLRALAGGVDRTLATRYFEAWILRLTGIFPAPHGCPVCGGGFGPEGALLPASGESLVCRQCAGPGGDFSKVPQEVLDFLCRIDREALEKVARDRIPPRVLAGVGTVCRRVRRGFLHRELRSYRVLQQALATP